MQHYLRRGHLIVVFMFLLIVGFSCSADRPKEMVFGIEETRTISLDYLTSNGFKRVYGVDVPLFEKLVGDTTVHIQFEQDGEGLYLKYWSFAVPTLNTSWLNDFFSSYNTLIISGNDYDMTKSFSFMVQSMKNNVVFPCHVNYEGDQAYLGIYYYYPKL